MKSIELLSRLGFLLIASTLFSTTKASFSDQIRLSQNSRDAQPQDLASVIASSPLLSFHRSLCEIESISGNELAVGQFLVSYLEAHNFSVVAQKVFPTEGVPVTYNDRYNIIAFPKSSASTSDAGPLSARPKVLLSSHIDTVPPFLPYKLSVGSHSNASPGFDRSAIEIFGRGTVDDKACVATQTYAVLSLLSSSAISASDVGLVFVVGEEFLGDGMKQFSDSDLHQSLSESYGTVIFGEPTELNLVSGHKGYTGATIIARGKAAHSGYPWLGKNANMMLIPALLKLATLGDLPTEEGGLPNSEKYGNSTVNVGLIRGGVAPNVVPEYAEAKVAMRIAGGTAEDTRRIAAKAVKDVDEKLHVTFSQGYGPVDIDSDVEGFENTTVNYGTDVPYLTLPKGAKRYLYGPGSIFVAHSDHEALTVGDMEAAVEGYKKLILHALGKA